MSTWTFHLDGYTKNGHDTFEKVVGNKCGRWVLKRCGEDVFQIVISSDENPYLELVRLLSRLDIEPIAAHPMPGVVIARCQ